MVCTADWLSDWSRWELNSDIQNHMYFVVKKIILHRAVCYHAPNAFNAYSILHAFILCCNLKDGSSFWPIWTVYVYHPALCKFQSFFFLRHFSDTIIKKTGNKACAFTDYLSAYKWNFCRLELCEKQNKIQECRENEELYLILANTILHAHVHFFIIK